MSIYEDYGCIRCGCDSDDLICARCRFQSDSARSTHEHFKAHNIYRVAVPLYEYRWNRMGRKGRICRVLVRGGKNSCLIEFADGFRAVTSRNALRKLK